MQLAPHIVDDSSLVVFQRSPAWMMPTPDWQAPVPTGLAWLLRNVPHYERFYRLYTFASLSDDLQHFSRIDASWDDGGRSVSKLNARFRAVLQDYLDDQFSDRPDLLPRVSPDYPPFGKRIVRDDGGWAMALKHPNTTLVTTPIERFTETGIVTADGAHHDVDVVVYGTGFEASKFLVPMRITGRGGIDLHRRWGADTSAYLGMTVPGSPNFFMLYGPNTNIVLNGSVVWLSECEVRYVLGCLRLALEQGGPLSCRQEVYDAFAEEIDTANREMAWGSDAVNSWYKNASGRVTQNWPLTLLEFWRRTRTPNLTDFEVAASTTVENTVRSNRCVRS
jgi:4-hydroxyacetophenone monooxygenase